MDEVFGLGVTADEMARLKRLEPKIMTSFGNTRACET